MAKIALTLNAIKPARVLPRQVIPGLVEGNALASEVELEQAIHRWA
jgi:hypothetical protein